MIVYHSSDTPTIAALPTHVVVLVADEGVVGEHEPPSAPQVLLHRSLVQVATEGVVHARLQGLREGREGRGRKRGKKRGKRDGGSIFLGSLMPHTPAV